MATLGLSIGVPSILVTALIGGVVTGPRSGSCREKVNYITIGRGREARRQTRLHH